MTRWWLALSLGLLPACTGGSSSTADESAETSESETSTETGSTTGSDLFAGPIEFILHPTQPMVVDVRVPLTEAGDVTITHAFDPGVLVAPLDLSDALAPVYRLRGLAPVTQHGIDVDVSVGPMQDTQLAEFLSGPALPGFRATVSPTVVGTPEPVYRLMDWSNFGGMGAEPFGAAAIDAEGQTRWYYGEANPVVGGASMAALRILDNGDVAFIHEGRLKVIDELGISKFDLSPAQVSRNLFHHDLVVLPNQNYLILDTIFQDVDYPVEGPLQVAGDEIIELTPSGEVVWSWNSFDHLDPLRRRAGFDDEFPPLINPDNNMPGKDWTHGNGLEYRASDDSILLSLRHQDWLVSIDHASGQVNWRLGDEGDFQLDTGSWFFHQHSPQWQPDGSLLLYDNGYENPLLPVEQEFSRAVRYELDSAAMTASQVWEDDSEDFLNLAMGDADRMPGGHYLVSDSALGLQIGFADTFGRVRELDSSATPQTQWSFETPLGYYVYRATSEIRLPGMAAP